MGTPAELEEEGLGAAAAQEDEEDEDDEDLGKEGYPLEEEAEEAPFAYVALGAVLGLGTATGGSSRGDGVLIGKAGTGVGGVGESPSSA